MLWPMSDDWYSPGHQIKPIQRKPRPREPVWTVRKDHVTWTCELVDQAEWGTEVKILRDGDLVIGRRFETRALALALGGTGTRRLRPGVRCVC